MSPKTYLWIYAFLFGAALVSCQKKSDDDTSTTFTKADSVTDTYLLLQDSVYHAWHLMMKDESTKLESMASLIHELEVSVPQERGVLQDFTLRLDQIKHMRYSQKTMSNPHVIEEYDLAANTLITELIAFTESQPQFAYNPTMQKLVEEISLANDRMENYRAEYDMIAAEFNRFVSDHRDLLRDLTTDSVILKPLFQAVSDEE